MIKSGKMWVTNEEDYFFKIFQRTGDKFDAGDLEFALKNVKNKSVALDVGAHFGSWTRILSQKFNEVVAVEGAPENFNCLLKNTEQFHNIECINCAIGNDFGNVDIGFLPGQPTKNSGGMAIIGDGDIPMITIDSLNLKALDFLKIDIEGYEIPALRGGMKTIMKYKPVIVIEDNIRNVQQGFRVGDNIKFLENLGAKRIKSFPSDNHVFVWN